MILEFAKRESDTLHFSSTNNLPSSFETITTVIMKAVLFLSALLSLGVSALPEPDNAVITEGDYTYKGIDKVRASRVL